jgi:hypothetical protein
MYREIIIPTEQDCVIHLPAEYVGQSVEIIANELHETQAGNPFNEVFEEAEYFWRTNAVDMANYKFDREDANKRQNIS